MEDGAEVFEWIMIRVKEQRVLGCKCMTIINASPSHTWRMRNAFFWGFIFRSLNGFFPECEFSIGVEGHPLLPYRDVYARQEADSVSRQERLKAMFPDEEISNVLTEETVPRYLEMCSQLPLVDNRVFIDEDATSSFEIQVRPITAETQQDFRFDFSSSSCGDSEEDGNTE